MKDFFSVVRNRFGNLSSEQVRGMEFLVKAVKALPRKHQAYVLATAWHETAGTMQPIEEYGKGKNKIYGKIDPATGYAYYGRGYVQLTWKDNYIKAQKRLRELGVIGPEVDFVKKPFLVMEPEIAAKIIVTGMSEGWFTTKRMGDFDNYISMRAVVNGKDKAKLIADYAETFEHALVTIRDEPVLPPIVDAEPLPPKEEKEAANPWAWLIAALLTAAGTLAVIFSNGGN